MTDPYRILVTGSRDWADRETIWGALAEIVRPLPAHQEIVIVQGACPGVRQFPGADRIAVEWALSYGATVESHPAQNHPTEDFGPWPGCGPRRNHYMAVKLGADSCLAFIGPCTKRTCLLPKPHGSHGASGCAMLAELAGIPVRRFTVVA